MRILTTTDGYDWVVAAPWLGTERVVFRGSLLECIAWRSQNQ